MNINLVLCEEYDDKTETIIKMFNKIVTNANKEATFYIMTFVGAERNDTEESFTLHYYIMTSKENSEGKRKGIYVGATGFISDSLKRKETEKGTMLNEGNTFAEIKCEDIPFPEEGIYEIEVYKISERVGDKTYDELKKESAKYRREGKLASQFFFEVKFPQ